MKAFSCVFYLIYVSIFFIVGYQFLITRKFVSFYVSESQGVFRANSGHHISVCTPAPPMEVSSLSVTQQWKIQNLSWGELSTLEHPRHLQDEEALEALQA